MNDGLLRHTLVIPPVSIVNDGPRLLATSYWQTDQAMLGYLFLSTNAGCLRLLVPRKADALLTEMTEAVAEVVLTRGRYEGQADAVEVLFEDGSETPLSVTIDPKLVDRRWIRADEARQHRFAVYGQDRGCVIEYHRCFLRQRRTLPCLERWQGFR